MVFNSALAQVQAYLLDPPPDGRSAAPAMARRPLVVVAGLAPGCGCTAVARGLAAALAERDDAGAAAVTGSAAPGLVPLGSTRARRLAREMRSQAAGPAVAVGRLCLLGGEEPAALAEAARWVAPAVIDVPSGEPVGPAAAAADAVVLVASPSLEPALAAAAAASLGRIGPEPLVTLNRGSGAGERWEGRAHAELPDSRAGARLAMAGLPSRGALGDALAELAAEVAP